jgi:hypothetical protein
MGIVPDSPLAKLLMKLGRADRRLLLATITAKPGLRRMKMQRQVRKRLRELGLE